MFHIDIEKQLGSEFWSNRYICDMNSIAQGIVLAGDIVDAERLIHSGLVTFTKFRVSDLDTELYQITTLNVQGQRSNTDLLPLFNTLRYDLTADGGRPSRKFYRGCLGEADINGSAVSPISTAFVDALGALFKAGVEGQGIVGPQGEFLLQVVQHPFVQMRQLRRGTRRRTQPIFQ